MEKRRKRIDINYQIKLVISIRFSSYVRCGAFFLLKSLMVMVMLAAAIECIRMHLYLIAFHSKPLDCNNIAEIDFFFLAWVSLMLQFIFIRGQRACGIRVDRQSHMLRQDWMQSLKSQRITILIFPIILTRYLIGMRWYLWYRNNVINDFGDTNDAILSLLIQLPFSQGKCVRN